MFDKLRDNGFQIDCLSHAQAILEGDFPDALSEIEEVLLTQTIPIEEIIGSGGGETKVLSDCDVVSPLKVGERRPLRS